MATLEESTRSTKRLGLGCIAIVIVVSIFQVLSQLLQTNNALMGNVKVATNGYGPLPELSITSLELPEESTPVFSVETPTGRLPVLPTIVNVYKFEGPRESLVSLDKAIDVATAYEFEGNYQLVGDDANVLRWSVAANKQTFTYNKLLEDFTLATDYKSSSLVSKKYAISAQYEEQKEISIEYLKKSELYLEALEKGSQTVEVLKLTKEKKLVRASSPDDANFIRINHFYAMEGVTPDIPENATDAQIATLEETRKQYEVVYQDPYHSQIYTIFGGNDTPLSANLTYWNIEPSFQTYNTIPVLEAYQKLQQEKKYLVYLNLETRDPNLEYIPLNVERFDIKNVDFAYFQTDDFEEYLQPVYVFSGSAKIKDSQEKATFIFYYPAIAHN